MNNQTKILSASSIQAIGTVVAAFGTTPAIIPEENLRDQLIVYGNLLQGTGNALQADTEEAGSFGRLGNQIQASGNIMVASGYLIELNDETKTTLSIKGSLLQAVGGGVVLSAELEKPPSLLKVYNVSGNLLQIIGNTMQAMGGISMLRESGQKRVENDQARWLYGEPGGFSLGDAKSDGQYLDKLGSWVQAIGAILSAMAGQKELLEENKWSRFIPDQAIKSFRDVN